jgi:protein translocase SecG subunit
MKTAIIVIQVISLILVIVSVLLQQKGTGLSGVFGGSSNYYQTKRGAEKFLFYTTIFSALAFFLATIYQIFAK